MDKVKENIHFSSKTDNWATPQDFFDTLNKEFDFNLDPCADKTNAKCKLYYSSGGLEKSWNNYRVFCNPPYGRVISQWVKKASEAVGGVVVMLIPARTDTRYFHEYIYRKPNVEVRFLKGRLKFGGSKNSAPFPSMIVVFTPLLTTHKE
jgi:phage N-6-adenine-methyltransferase